MKNSDEESVMRITRHTLETLKGVRFSDEYLDGIYKKLDEDQELKDMFKRTSSGPRKRNFIGRIIAKICK